MGTKWRGNTGSLGQGYLILIKSANLDAEQRSAENVATLISSCLRISMLVCYWHMFVNVGGERCPLDVVISIIWHQFRLQIRTCCRFVEAVLSHKEKQIQRCKAQLDFYLFDYVVLWPI